MAEALRLAELFEIEADLESLYRQAAAELRRLHAENERLAAALASSCDEQRHELWESGGVAGCERARVAERQRDTLLAEHQQTLALQQRSYEREIQLEVEAEREACAKVCYDKANETFSGHCQVWGDYFARAIRARGNT